MSARVPAGRGAWPRPPWWAAPPAPSPPPPPGAGAGVGADLGAGAGAGAGAGVGAGAGECEGAGAGAAVLTFIQVVRAGSSLPLRVTVASTCGLRSPTCATILAALLVMEYPVAHQVKDGHGQTAVVAPQGLPHGGQVPG